VRVSKVGYGVVVASLENNSPVARVAAVVNSGSRDENANEAGAAHALRVYSSLSTRNYSVFGLSRTLSQIGAGLTVLGGREQTTFLLESNRNYSHHINIYILIYMYIYITIENKKVIVWQEALIFYLK
jgi:ubiquinol-cytochrome c reductase core subunit 2